MFARQFKGLLKRFGYQLVPIDAAHSPWVATETLLKDVPAPVIFDVGACTGNTIKKYQRLFPASRIYAFEPFTDSFELASALAAKGDRKHRRPAAGGTTQVFNIALGAVNGTQTFHVNSFAPTNSLLPSDPRASEVWGPGHYETARTVEVEVRRLDDFLPTVGVDHIDLMKLDVQGAESQVLEGARGILARGGIRVIQTEIIFAPAYEGQKSFAEMSEIFTGLGFELFNLYEMWSINGRITHCDALFVRAGG